MLRVSTFLMVVGVVMVTTELCPASIVSKDILRQYFETGDKPTEAQFASLIDSTLNVELVYGDTIGEHALALDNGGIATQGGTGWAVGHVHGATIGSGETYTPTAGVGAGSVWPGFDGFVGLAFELDDAFGVPQTHYGFLQMSVDGVGSGTPYAIHLVGFAYETEAGTPIETFDIPEPSGLVLMGLGVAGLVLRRRARVG